MQRNFKTEYVAAVRSGKLSQLVHLSNGAYKLVACVSEVRILLGQKDGEL